MHTMLRSGGGGLARWLGQAANDGKLTAQRIGPLSQAPTHTSAAVQATAAAEASQDAAAAEAAGLTGSRFSWKKAALVGLGTGIAGVGLALAEEEAEHGLHAPSYPWSHDGYFSSYDHASIRRGHQVYTQVCAACHSMQSLHYRNLVGVAYTEEEMKEAAAEAEMPDGPNEEGEMFERPGRLADPLPKPYPNEEAARYANGGAYPPDLSLITKARHDGQNYVFALLLGYRDTPAGVHIREGLYYNPYFPGGAIAMPKMLADGGTEYDDETIATESQQAKDVVTFLSWAAEPEHDDRKLQGFKWIFVLSLVAITAAYYKRWKWAPIKSRRVVVDALN